MKPARLFVTAVLTVILLGGAAAPYPAQAQLPTADGVPTLAPLLERITPAVVNIAVTTHAAPQQNPLYRDPFFRFFFDIPQQQKKAPPQMAAGSGVIVDAEKGYVLTNNHVVENADEIRVTLKDRRSFAAKLIGTDKGTDIALLRIPPENLTALKFGDSDALRVGDFVVAIGNPFAIGQTVTSGIVSALGRSGLNIEGYEDFIQTDASINPGNSGGALVSLKGELVGINTAIIGPAGGNVGIGFAVPSRMARAVMQQLLEYGEVRRGRLGVGIQDVTPDIAGALSLPSSRGAIITQVEPGSPAETAGFKAGDVAVALNGEPLRNSSDLRNRIGLTPVGEEVTIAVIRDGKTLQLKTKVGGPTAATAASTETVPRLAGAVLRSIPRGHPLYGKVKGVLVAGVEAGSPAWRSGLREGDLITAINRHKVTTVAGIRKAIKKNPTVLAMNIIRDGIPIFIVVQ